MKNSLLADAALRVPAPSASAYGRERGSCMRAGSMSPRNDHDGRADYSYLLQDPGKRQANHDDSTSQ
jgi:hypothetical protein